MKFPRRLGLSASLACLLGSASSHGVDLPRPPGLRPLEAGVHALTGARIVTQPGQEIEKGVVILRDGRIEAVGTDLAPPPDARVHDLSGATIYPGFLDAYVTPGSSARSASPTEQPPVDDLTAGAGSGFLGTSSAAGEPGTKSLVTPQRSMAREYAPTQSFLESLRHEGFTAAHILPESGILRGSSALVSLGEADPDAALIRPEVCQHVSFEVPKGSGEGSSRPKAYPGSLMGVIAVIRQTFFDAQFQATDLAHYAAHPQSRPRPAIRTPLEALRPAIQQQMPVLFEPTSALMVERAMVLARELQLRPAILASGQEWRRPEMVRAAEGAPFIVPVDFPEVVKLPEDADWLAVPFEQLRAWDHAPGNPALIRQAGREMALTTHGLAKKSAFRANVRLAIARGLSETDALAALTTAPARILGVEDQLGTLEPGKLAHLTIFENGRCFDEKARLREVWIDGRRFPAPLRTNAPKPASAPEKAAAAKDAPEVANDKKDAPAPKATAKSTKPKPAPAPLRHSLTAAPSNRDRGPLLSPKSVLIRGATVWTCGPEGRLENASLLITGGRITQVGHFKADPGPDTHVIDLPGIHVTPGLIDCHSHSMILGGVNEGTLTSSAMVRIGDVVNSEAEMIHQQLAGGLTIANLLHGSANPIGGQNCVIKLRDGAPPERLKLRGAPGGIKFALGENVKQANWGDAFRHRFPQSRMGVPAFHTNRFTAAQQYQAALDAFKRQGGPPVRRDLELEALAEILRGERLIHCHSYRQDEILAFLRVMEGFKVRVGTLQHILEGYKVADEIARHGAGASAFSDWWAFKFEVYDAIPHAGSIMHQRGVLVSFNSDSSDHARRMNLEAAKAVKYGGTPEEEALKFVTLNPAIQLGIDRRVGSLEPGKDGDFALWSGHPLATSSRCLQTWIEGRQYFEHTAAQARAEARQKERLALIEKAKKSLASSSAAASLESKAGEKFFLRALEDRQGHLCVDCCMDREILWKN